MKGEIVPLMSINYTVKYAETFLSLVGAKTNRLVHQTRQQHSQKPARSSSSAVAFSIFYSLAIPSGKFIPSSKVMLVGISSPRTLVSLRIPPDKIGFLDQAHPSSAGPWLSCSESSLSWKSTIAQILNTPDFNGHWCPCMKCLPPLLQADLFHFKIHTLFVLFCTPRTLEARG